MPEQRNSWICLFMRLCFITESFRHRRKEKTMAERKPLSKTLRFEVFKRDKFTCQYCGRMAPDVILEVDHINPVSEGGENELLNLITSCRDCNRGKGKRKLSDSKEIQVQQDRLKDIAEKKEQLELIMQWKNELLEFQKREVDYLSYYIYSLTDYWTNDSGNSELKKLLHQFSHQEILEAIDIAFSKYFKFDEKSWNYAFNKIGGICYNRKNNRNSWDKQETK